MSVYASPPGDPKLPTMTGNIEDNLSNEWIRTRQGERSELRENSIWRSIIIYRNGAWNGIWSLLIDKPLAGECTNRTETLFSDFSAVREKRRMTP
jgi:hypothetical protein